jgi:hypothetical protein
MKILSLTIFSLIQIGLLAQNDSLSIKTNKFILDQREIIFIKQFISKKDSSIDLRFKKIGFVGGRGGEILMDKFEFFKRYLNSHDKGLKCSLIRLTENEIKESGGFEFLIMYPAMIFRKATRQKLIRKLKTAS